MRSKKDLLIIADEISEEVKREMKRLKSEGKPFSEWCFLTWLDGFFKYDLEHETKQIAVRNLLDKLYMVNMKESPQYVIDIITRIRLNYMFNILA